MALIGVGLVVGIASSLFGVGGGIITIPALFALLPNLPVQTVVGSSLLVTFFISLVNLRNFWKSGLRPDINVLKPMMISAAIGALGGSLLAEYLQKSTIKLIFAVMITLVAIQILIDRLRKSAQGKFVINHYKSSLVGLTGGMASGLTGIGGGAVMVPLFIKFLKMPIKKVSLYSNCVMPCGVLVGSLTFLSMKTPTIGHDVLKTFQFGQLNLAISALIALGSFATSSLGVRASQKISRELLQYLLALLLLIVACKLFWESL